MSEARRDKNNDLSKYLVGEIVRRPDTPPDRAFRWLKSCCYCLGGSTQTFSPSDTASQNSSRRCRVVNFPLTGMGFVTEITK